MCRSKLLAGLEKKRGRERLAEEVVLSCLLWTKTIFGNWWCSYVGTGRFGVCVGGLNGLCADKEGLGVVVED